MGIYKWNKFAPLIVLGMSCGGVLAVSAFADDDGKDQPPAKPAEARIDSPAPLTERERQLMDRVEQLEKRMAELESKAHSASTASPTSNSISTSAIAARAGGSGAVSAQPASVEVMNVATAGVQPAVTEKTTKGATKPAKAEPFAFADFTWLNGNSRTKDTPYATSFFTPEIRADVNYNYSFNHPKDDTIGGSSEVFRHGEVQLTQLGVGGDFHLDNVRGAADDAVRYVLADHAAQRRQPARGQWNLDNAYRYISEAYGGYHFDALHGDQRRRRHLHVRTSGSSATTSSTTGRISPPTCLRTLRGSSTACVFRSSPPST